MMKIEVDTDGRKTVFCCLYPIIRNIVNRLPFAVPTNGKSVRTL